MLLLLTSLTVALRKESVDRNASSEEVFFQASMSLSARRAWIEISASHFNPYSVRSLSARRAWIEISVPQYGRSDRCVALRKESVDRNVWLAGLIFVFCGSLSARRAWIEIVNPDADTLTDDGRSPQGERG